MQSSLSVRKIIIFDLILHTAIVIMLTLIATRGGSPPSNLLLMVALIVAAIALAIYTAHRIIRCAYEKISHREKELSKLSTELQAWSENLERCGIELRHHAEMVSESHKVLERNVGLICNYGNRMNELVALIDTLGAEPVKNPLPMSQVSRGVSNHEP